jgi:uncharacterized protein with FMN-binding domain
MVGRSFGERGLDWRSRAGVRAVYTDSRITSSPLDAPASSVSKARGNNLVALGSAAVLIVYTAGFAKTTPAADRMAAESAERRPRSASRAGAGAVGGRTAAGESGESIVPATAAVAVVDAPAAASLPNTSSAVGTPAGVATPTAPSNVAVVGTPAAGATASTPAGATPPVSAPVATVETAPPPVVSAPASVAVTPPLVAAPAAAPNAPPPVQATPTPTPTPAPSPAPPAAAPAPAPAAKTAGKTTYKDGVYLGRGTSRHGDIEAMVEIQGGRITNAVISQCLTRYSCSWIAVLVPQVVARQSAEVDYVSGATVSSDAFYYAVTQALAQAK